MKIAWIRYPEKLYSTGKILRGGSELANQYVIDWLRANGQEVIDFMPESNERINLIASQAIGTPLMFQDLLKRIDEINACDLVVTTNWFGVILPEIKKPVCVIFHSNANLVLDSIKKENIFDSKNLNKWLEIAQSYDLAKPSAQSKHETVISLGEQFFASNANRIIAVSALLKESLIKFYNAKQSKISVINNSYPQEWSNVDPTKKFGNSMSIIHITRLPGDYNGFVGKGTDRLLEVLSKFPNEQKTILASTNTGAYKALLNRTLKNYNLVENANRGQVKTNLEKAHISIHVSRCEACQLTLIESMLMKTLPITFAVGVASELIRSGENGFIVKSTKEMSEKIKWALKHPQQAELMAEAARQTIIEKLAIEKIGQEYLKTFTILLK